MKIRLNTRTKCSVEVTGLGVVEHGQTVEVSDDLGAHLIAQGGWEAAQTPKATTAAAKHQPSEE